MRGKGGNPGRAALPSAGNRDADKSAPDGPQGASRQCSGSEEACGERGLRTSASASDADLARRLATGDRQAFETLYLRHRQDLLDFISRRYRYLDSHAAEDVIGEVFLDIWRHRHRLGEVHNFRAYVKGIAHNLVADRLALQEVSGGEFLSNVESSAQSAAATMERDELAQHIEQAISLLALPHRMPLELSRWGLSAKQIASILDCTEKAAQRRVEKSRERLKLSLSRCGPSCVINTARQDQCPARIKDWHCLKWLYYKRLRATKKI